MASLTRRRQGMTGSLIVVALGAVAAAAGTGVLAAHCARTPRLFLLAWTVAVFALAVALAAQALGYLSGFSGPIFRAMELGGQAVAPLALCLGLVELIGRSIVSRFAMRLAVSAIGVIVLVIMGSDPLSPNVTLSSSWPDPAVVYQLVPVALIKFLAVFTLATALGAVLAAAVRSSRGREFSALVRPVLIAATAAVLVALPGAAMLAGASLGSAGFALSQLGAALLTWYATVAAGRNGVLDPAQVSGREPAQDPRYGSDEDDWSRPAPLAGAGYNGHDSYDDLADSRYVEPDVGVGNPALAALAAEPDGKRRQADDYDGHEFDSDVYTGKIDPYMEGQAESQGPPFGQITIYTVLDERTGDFDEMTERVVEQVRANEPGTLVYIAHAVPTAPMQRILYEVYQDRAAYDDHLMQPYVARFESERRSMVLATNSIELGLKQAKVSPLPSFSAISDILSESGIDLTGVTKAGREGAPGTGSPASRSRSGQREALSPGPGGSYRDEPEYEPWRGDEGRYP